MMKKIALVFGTRPEIIKLSPIIRLLQKNKQPFVLIHTGQHYSFNMDQQFFNDLKLPEPKHKFTRPSELGANKHEEILDWMRGRISDVLKTEDPNAVLVQGDTNSVLAGAQAAKALNILVGHVEAGLRSGDLNMPEERNRIATDKISDLLYVPTPRARQNLLNDGYEASKIIDTGNTIVDAVLENIKIADSSARSAVRGYALVTLHRPETVDNKERMLKVVAALERIAEQMPSGIIFPIHPRTRQRLVEHGIDESRLKAKRISIPEPAGFLDFLYLEKHADIILTDSGGVQEEACILNVPCVTIRTTTERPETVEAGANVVAGYDPDNIVVQAEAMMKKPKNWKNPFGDGKASERILASLETVPA